MLKHKEEEGRRQKSVFDRKPKMITVRQRSSLKRVLILRALGHTHIDIAAAIKQTNERRTQLLTTFKLQLTMPFLSLILDIIQELFETMMGR